MFSKAYLNGLAQHSYLFPKLLPMHLPNDAFTALPANQAEPFETDTQKLMHRHLHDKDHVITDEELKSLRVGMRPPDAGSVDGNA